MAHWAIEQQQSFGYDKPFAVVALGGTGRGEMTPFSDNDFAFLFEDALEGNPFLLELQRQIFHSDVFEKRCGFACLALPFSLEDVPNLEGKQLNAFVDMRPLHDPDGLAGRFRERIRATYDPFEHFLHVRGFWKDQWEKAAGEYERLERFDIKNDGLRVFLAGIWTLAGKRFVHSHEIYQTIEDPRDLDAYDFLLRIRAFVHSRRTARGKPNPSGNHPEDILEFEDFTAFGELLGPQTDERSRFEFANDVRARLLSARRRVASFAKGVIGRELKSGREVSSGNPIQYGLGGLYHANSDRLESPREKSRAALSLLRASQRYDVPIDPSELFATFRNAGDWLIPVPEVSALFYEPRGSLADSFAFLSQMDGAVERLFRGYARFEVSLDSRVLSERRAMRGALERQKIRTLEGFVREGRARLANSVSPSQATDLSAGLSVEIEAALLDADHLAAVKLALKTKRLPLTPQDQLLRRDETRPLYDRFSTGLSGIPLKEYYDGFCTQCDFPRETIRLAEFLVTHRRTFKERSEAGINDARQVDEFANMCKDEHLLRSLFVFTCADRAEWECDTTDPARWFNTRELYAKALRRFKPAADPTQSLRAAGYSPEEFAIIRDFGVDFFGGVYRQYATRFGSHLVRLAQEPERTGPRASVLRDGASTIVGIAARDYRGLAACISGALWNGNVQVMQAHLFSAMNHGLALDFFHLAPREKPLAPDFTRSLENAIRLRLFTGDADETGLPRAPGSTALKEWRPGQYCLRFDTPNDISGLIYALTYKVFRHLRGNIFGLNARTARKSAFVSIYLSLPPDLPLDRAREIVAERF